MAELIKARQFREERKRLSQQAFDLANKANNTPEDRTAANKMLDDADALKVQIDLLERAETADAEYRGGRNNPPNGEIDPGGSDDPVKIEQRKHKAWSNFMRYGWEPKPTMNGKMIRGISQEDRAILSSGSAQTIRDPEELRMVNEILRGAGAPELRDMGTGNQGAYPGATTGFFVPVGFVNRVEEAMKYFGPMLNGGVNMPEIFDTSTGQILPFPVDNDASISGELIGENQQVTVQDVTLGQIILGAYKFSTKLVKVSIELLQDSAFDFESFLVRKFGTRLGRVVNTYTTIGTGVNQPQGIITGSTLGVTFAGAFTNDGVSGANSVGSDDLINLLHSVDIAYRNGAMYMFNDDTLRQLKTIKDKFGRPLWLPGLAVQAPDTINQMPYAINNDMAKLQTAPSSPPVTNKTVLFGQLSKFLIRRVKELSVIRLEERFADYGQIAFLGFARYDSAVLDAGTHPIKYGINIY